MSAGCWLQPVPARKGEPWIPLNGSALCARFCAHCDPGGGMPYPANASERIDCHCPTEAENGATSRRGLPEDGRVRADLFPTEEAVCRPAPPPGPVLWTAGRLRQMAAFQFSCRSMDQRPTSRHHWPQRHQRQSAARFAVLLGLRILLSPCAILVLAAGGASSTTGILLPMPTRGGFRQGSR